MPPPRDIVHDPEFDADCTRIGPLPLLDAALQYATYRLAQSPLLGVQITASLWAQPLRLFGRDLVIYYRFDANTLTLRGLKAPIK